MALENKYKITVNTKSRMFREIPEVVANDNVVFEIEVYEGATLFPLLPAYSYKFVSKKNKGNPVIRDALLVGGLARVELGTSEMTEPGKVEGTLQIYDAEMKRISTAEFSYIVKRDPSMDGELPNDERNLIIANESLLIDAIDKAEQSMSRVDELITKAPQPSEVVDARGGETTLGARLNNLSSSVAQKVSMSEVRKNTAVQPINVSEMDTETKALFTGGAVAVVGLNSTGTENLKDKSATEEKVTFLDIDQRNIYNKYRSTDGYRLDTTGNLFADAAYSLSDYVPVKTGQVLKVGYSTTGYSTYRICGYDMNKAFVKQITTGLSSTSLTVIDITIDFNGYIRVPFQLSAKNIAVISDSLAYEGFRPYEVKGVSYLKAQPALNSVGSSELIDEAVSASKTNFAVSSKNIFDKSKALIGYALNGTTGEPAASATYSMTEFIPVESGQTYPISNPRSVAFYSASKQFLSNAYINNSSNTPIVVTAPQDGFLRATLLNTYADTFQIEKGTVHTAYEVFGVVLPNLLLTDVQKQSVLPVSSEAITLVKTGEIYSISSRFEGVKDITIETTKNISANGVFNFTKTTIGTDVIHTNNDDISPLRMFYTAGANHGYASVRLNNTDKTVADIGTRWTDGTYEWILSNVTGGYLEFISMYTVVDGVSSSIRSSLSSSATQLTQIGGTSSNIPVAGLIYTQLYPSINNLSTRYYIDDTEIALDGKYTGKSVKVVESYNILEYKKLVDFILANPGVSFRNRINEIGGLARMGIVYHFLPKGKCAIHHNLRFLNKANLIGTWFLQSVPLTLTGNKTFQYMPNVLPKGGYDFQGEVDMTNYASSLIFGNADLIEPTIPPNRYVQWLKNSTSGIKKAGFTMGYIVDKTDSSHAKRLANSTEFWDLRDTKKNYPTAIKRTFEKDEYLNFIGYRNYLSADDHANATNINIVPVGSETYVYLDYHKTLSFENVKLQGLLGKSITIVESKNFSLHNNIVDADGVLFSILNGYGYAILKVS
jgi:hypothetical protein